MDANTVAALYLLALCIWREARNQILSAKVAVGFSVRNRVMSPGWWGSTWVGVITKKEQYSSFNPSDPNAAKWPDSNDTAFPDCWESAQAVFSRAVDDPTRGATHYIDRSLWDSPPVWAAAMEQTAEIGDFRFYKAAA